MKINKTESYGWFPCRSCGKKGMRFKENPCSKCKRENILVNLDSLQMKRFEYASKLILNMEQGKKISKRDILVLQK